MTPHPRNYGSLPTYEKDVLIEVSDAPRHMTSLISCDVTNGWSAHYDDARSERMKRFCLNARMRRTLLGASLAIGALFVTRHCNTDYHHVTAVPDANIATSLVLPVDMSLLTVDAPDETSPGAVWGSK
eukprot:CAMPEP_0172485348 /NCGR_PEP_ID=MMETSP1066-20121228/13382_1 /TAXON_ID=671091 /ORGANISM="Coscinodiscus wailesii, Strain CCMP2513" /LENGTH=127 /DNA_ID=CAMNT_0013250569 /DNA_START=80 /DNA_END=464 /DNA_ORIENTATION=-